MFYDFVRITKGHVLRKHENKYDCAEIDQYLNPLSVSEWFHLSH